MELQVTTLDGKTDGSVTLKDDIFGLEVRQDILHRMVRYQQLKAMAGTHKVKTRSEVRGGGKKPFRQKHTGMARQGTRRSALSLKVREGQIRVVEDFSFEAPRTREMAGLVKAMGCDGNKTLVLLPKSDRNVVLAGRNMPAVQVLEADKASTYDLLNNRVLLIQKSAVEVLQNTFKN